MRNVLSFFGAFNPPTCAHLELADFACRETGREGVIFVPSRSDYIRNDQQKDGVLSGEKRLALLRKLAETRPWMHVTNRELLQPAQPRTYVTLCSLREEGYSPTLLLGWSFVYPKAKRNIYWKTDPCLRDRCAHYVAMEKVVDRTPNSKQGPSGFFFQCEHPFERSHSAPGRKS